MNTTVKILLFSILAFGAGWATTHILYKRAVNKSANSNYDALGNYCG